MTLNRLVRLTELGQSVWYDYIRRDLFEGPALRRLIEEDGLSGMTSNPTIGRLFSTSAPGRRGAAVCQSSIGPWSTRPSGSRC